MALRLGLSGPYCSGKNAAAAFLEGRGILVLDVDRLGHQALASARDAVAARFGPSVISADGTVNRRALAAIAFGDRRSLADLEAIVHPEANRLAEEWLSSKAGRDVCVNAALLHLMPAARRLDAIILVEAPFFLRFLRGLKRDGSGFRATLRRMASQRGFARALDGLGRPLMRVRNAGSLKTLHARLDAALSSLRPAQ